MSASVVVRSVGKRFGRLTALEDITFTLDHGITGLLGPNGAGKTTMLRCLATVERPDRGSLRIAGRDPQRASDRTEIRRRLGYLPQEPGFYPTFTAYDFLDYIAVLKELLDDDVRRREVLRVLAEVDLADRATTKVRKLSGGMRRRLGLAQALLGDPQLLILDEPTTGLDPGQRLRFRDLVSRLGENRVVLLSTHQTEDVAALCERVIVLNEGRSRFDGSPRSLAEEARGQVWLAADRPVGAGVTWKNADGLYRSIGDPPDGAELVHPTVEDGYLRLVGHTALSDAG